MTRGSGPKPPDNTNCNSFWNKKLRDEGWTVLRTSLHITEPEINYICEELIKWAEEDKEAIKIGMFHIQHGINFEAWGKWLEKFPQLRSAYKMAKYIIGERRERKGLKGEYNASLVAISAPLYDEELMALKREFSAARKAAEESAKQTVIVVQQKMPETSDVPVRGIEMAE